MIDSAADVARPARRVLQLPRYRAMEERFDRIGPYGRLMMCNTAATQVSVENSAIGGGSHSLAMNVCRISKAPPVCPGLSTIGTLDRIRASARATCVKVRGSTFSPVKSLEPRDPQAYLPCSYCFSHSPDSCSIQAIASAFLLNPSI